MSFAASPSLPMEEPRNDFMPSPVKQGNKTRHKKNNGRAKKDPQHPQQPSQLSSPNLNSTPSSIYSKPAHLIDSETVSNASLESSKSSRRRRHARGGGRKNKSKQHIASQQQPDAQDKSQTSEQQQLQDAVERELYGSDSERDEGQHPDEGHPGHHREQEKEQEQEQHTEKPSGTGIRAFNVRRSDPKGGRPVGMKPQRKGTSQRTAAQDPCVHCGQSQQPSSEGPEPSQPSQPETQQTRIPRISVKQNPPRQEPGQEGEGAGQEEQQAKEFSIKIDLNLELEIAFKAKVKGEIMLTFLE